MRVHQWLTWLAWLLVRHLLTWLASGLGGLWLLVHNLLSVRLYIHHLSAGCPLLAGLLWNLLVHHLLAGLSWLTWLLVHHGLLLVHHGLLVVVGGSGSNGTVVTLLRVLDMHGMRELRLLFPLLFDAADDADDDNDRDHEAERGKRPPEPNKVIYVVVVVVIVRAGVHAGVTRAVI